MNLHRLRLLVTGICIIAAFAVTIHAAKLISAEIVDKDYLLVHFKNGDVTFKDDGKGPDAFATAHFDGMDTVKPYGSPLDTVKAMNASSWVIKSSDDPAYGSVGKSPGSCYRKTKLCGMAEKEWVGSDFRYEYTLEHFLYLKLPTSLIKDITYTLEINAGLNSDINSSQVKFDIYTSRSEAIHTNLVGYSPDVSCKSADLYLWMGSGGGRDYSTFINNSVYLYNVENRTKTAVGTVSFWKNSASEAQGYNLIQSNVWNADFNSFALPGTYRLAIDGVGCSQDFRIDNNIYYEPFQVSVKGFFYMRVGQDTTPGVRPVPRRPLYLPGTSPSNTTVYITTMCNFDPNWNTFSSGGDPWDKKTEWAAYKKAGSPTNPNAYGGHSDALDWDRHLGHVGIIWDMLLPFILTKGVIKDDNLGISESGNGIPDIIDEARYEVDYWLRLRDGAAYSHGVNNPDDNNVLYQAGTSAIAAWANAANAAMLADCFRILGNTQLMNTYRDSAVAAYNFAGGLPNQLLDGTNEIGDGVIRGRDMKMMAAAFLYNVTGNAAYETVVNTESVCTGATSNMHTGSLNQIWGTAAYLLTHRTISDPTLFNNMKASVVYQAKQQHTNFMNSRPSRRSTDNNNGYFQTMQNVHIAMIAHAITDNSTDKSLFRKSLVLEADYGLGRNPLNIIQMTTASTTLSSKRSIENAYTTGRNDGSPGLHPGHTPYMNTDDWSCGMVMGCPSWLTSKAYPSYSQWPKAESYFNTRYVWAHVEFTPQQTMRGKMALYGYLYGIDKTGGTPVHSQWVHDVNHNVTIGTAVKKLPEGLYSIRVIDMRGRTVWSKAEIKITSNTRIPVPLVGNKMYLITIQGKNVSITDKIISVLSLP